MNMIDLIILIPVAYATYKGFSRGIIIEAGSLLALVGGIYGALRFSSYTEEWIRVEAETSSEYLPMIAFVVTFVGIVIAVHLIARIVHTAIKAAMLGLPNRIAGAIFGLLKSTIIVSFLLVLVNSIDDTFQLIDNSTKQESLLFEPLSNVGPSILPMITEANWYRELDISDYDVELL